jgi:predicted acetyltransferase
VDYSIRYARAEEFPAITALDGASFGFAYSEQDMEDAKLDVDLDRMLVAVEGDRIVGASCELPLTVTLPGGHADVVGLSWVSVELTHRRRGILRGLVERQVRECAAAGGLAIILLASEGGIYGRYGFGSASDTRKVVVDRHGSRLLRPCAASGVRRISADEAREVLPPIYDRWRRRTPGGLDRSDARWQIQLMDRDYQRNGMSGLFHLVHPDGYVSYRIKADWNDGHPQHTCWITDYVVASPDAHMGLWQVLLGFDLCATIESHRVPLDDPLPHLLADPRRVRTVELNDGLWVRPLNLCGLLSARTYAVDVDVVLGVRDPLLGDGRYRLRGGPDGAECVATDAEADLDIDVADLGALSLGGRRLAPLVGARRVRAPDPGVVTRVDRALLADVAPQYGTSF